MSISAIGMSICLAVAVMVLTEIYLAIQLYVNTTVDVRYGNTMKVCMVIGGLLETGGIQTHTMELSRALADRGHDVRILCMGVKVPPPPNVTVDVVTEKPFTLGVYRRIKALRKNDDLDIVHSQGCAGINVIMNRLSGVPFVQTLHSTAVSEYRVSRRSLFDKKYYATFYLEEAIPSHMANAVICVSEYTAGQAISNYFLRRDKITVIPNGIDIDKFKDEGRHRKNGKTILMVGRIDPRKGYLEFVNRIAPGIVAKDPGIKINIVGDEFDIYKEYTESVKRAVIENRLADNIRFLGRVTFEELKMLYSSSDLFLLASKEEGFGIVLLEAQSCGLPVVAFNTSGIKEAAVNGKSGFLVDSYDEMVGKVVMLMSDETARREMGASAREFASRFSWKEIASRVEKVYVSVLGEV